MNPISSTLTNSVGASIPVQKKYIQVQEVNNGYVVTLGHGIDTKIATDKEEVLQFISEFIDTK